VKTRPQRSAAGRGRGGKGGRKQKPYVQSKVVVEGDMKENSKEVREEEDVWGVCKKRVDTDEE